MRGTAYTMIGMCKLASGYSEQWTIKGASQRLCKIKTHKNKGNKTPPIVLCLSIMATA